MTISVPLAWISPAGGSVGVQGSPTLPVLATDPLAGEIRARGTEIVIATSLTAD